MTHSERAVKLVAESENCLLTAYPDPIGIWTIGYGHTPAAQGQTISREDAEILLSEDLKTADTAINRLVKVPLNQNQFDALCSFVFNVGQGNFAQSTMLKALNESHFAAAAAEFLRWTRAGGKVLEGLVRRREAEKALFEQQVEEGA